MAQEPPLRASTSRHFLSWLHECGLSLAFTTYQTNRLFLVSLKPDGRLSIFERLFERPMGLHATAARLTMSTRYQIWHLDNALPGGETHEEHDRLYVPRHAYTTGDLDVHDVAVDSEDRIIFANTLYSCLATVSEHYSFRPIWKPPFVSRLAPEDRCHLNGLAMADGRPAYATAVSRSDVAAGWRERRHTGGCVIDIEDDEIVTDTLSMPHSPRVYRDRLWLLNSGMGELGYVDRRSGRFEPIVFCPGYLRGLAFHRDWAIVGLSKQRRERTFSGLALDDRLRNKDTDARCGLWVIDLRTGNVSHWLELEGVVIELYDVVVISEVRHPTVLGFKSDEIQRLITIEDTRAPRFEPLRTAEASPGDEPSRGGLAPPFPEGGEAEEPAVPAPPEYRQANELVRAGRYEDALSLYEEALRAQPRHVSSHINLGTAHHRLGNAEEARRCWLKALEIDPSAPRAHVNLARVLQAEGETEAAIGHWRRALESQPLDIGIRLELAGLLSAAGRLREARNEVETVLRREAGHARAWNALGALCFLEQKEAEALHHFQRAADLDPELFEAHLNRGNCFEALGQIAEARDAFADALAVRDQAPLVLRRQLLCPPVFASVEAIDEYYRRASSVIDFFGGRRAHLPLAETHLTHAEVPFNWAYLGRDDLAHRQAYADIFAESFRLPPLQHRPSNCPPWRVGFVVTPTHEGVFFRCMAGLLDQLDRRHVQPVLALPRASFSLARASLRERDVELVELPQRFDHATAALRRARLDALYFWEVGTDSTNYFLAFCRLAPVQCTGWGWPVPSAAPELDYHLTSESLAPPGTERFFSEPLIRLPHLPAHMQRPREDLWKPVPLEEYGLPSGGPLYLCVQNLRKVHPDMDALLEGILRASSRSVVAFVHDRAPAFGELLRARWKHTLADFSERLFLLPRQTGKRYPQLLASATALLDTPHFGGANTAYDSYLAGVPVVTLPGEQPRGRYTAALHAAAGVEGCTAQSGEEYVQLAVRLGTDFTWRREVCDQMRAGGALLFERREPAAQLESFLAEAIRGV